MAAQLLHLPLEADVKTLADFARQVGGVMKEGGLIAFPADTVWGLGCSALAPAAIERIRQVKGRREDHPFPLYAASAADVWTFCGEPSKAVESFAKEFWPGHLTMVLPLQMPLLKGVAGKDGTVGLRVPGSDWLRLCVGEIGAPMVNTSANRTGEPTFASAEEVVANLQDEVDLIVTTELALAGKPSTVIKPIDGGYELLREGTIAKSDLEEVLNVARNR